MNKYFSLSAEQKNFWIEWLLDPKSTVNNICFFYKLQGNLDVPRFLEAVTLVTQTSAPFKIKFTRKKNDVYLSIRSNLKSEINFIENNKHPFNKSKEEIDYLHKIINEPFDLQDEKLYRLILFKSFEKNVYFFVACLPHILIDGYSGDFILRKISQAYNSGNFEIKNTNNAILTTENNLFVHYKKDDYWLKKIDKITDYKLWKKNPSLSKEGTRSYLFINKEEIKPFKRKCYQSKTTTFLGLMTAFGYLLYRYFDFTDLALLYSVDLRTKCQKDYLGTYVNLIPMLFSFSENNTFLDILNQITLQRKNDKAYQDYPLEKIISNLRKKTSLSNFNIIFSKAKLFPNGFNLNEIDIEFVPYYPKTSITDLALLYDESDDGVIFTFEYNISLFDDDFIQNMLKHFKMLLVTLGKTFTNNIRNYSILNSEEQDKLLQHGYPKHQWQPTELNPVIEKFKMISQQFSKKIAIVSENEKFTYQQLDQHSNQIANYLQKINQLKSVKIAFLLTRSYSTIATILGIIKAACTYVPLDPSYPSSRLQYILDDANIDILITDTLFKEKVDNLSTKKTIYIYELLEAAYTENKSAVTIPISLHELAYIIYTSGSTGSPKGVPISHYNLARLFEITDRYFDFTSSDKWSLFHSLAFDFSVWEMWGAILHGGELHLLPDSIRQSPLETYLYIHEHHISILNQTPFAFKQLLAIDQEQKRPLDLRFIIFGGEKLNPEDLHGWFLNHPENYPKLINMYGLTEATVHATFHQVRVKEALLTQSIIGKPLADLGAYVLDKFHQPVPVGVIGELFLEGPGLTAGYLNQEMLNKNRFIFPTFPLLNKHRLYATGDLVCWLPDGNLEYIGRKDKQIKLNGYRIELNEINSALQSIPEIKQGLAFVQDLDKSQKQLIGFYLTKNNHHLDSIYISKQLKKLLPYYMIPSCFIQLHHMPLTTQGKLDSNYLQQLAKTKTETAQSKSTLPTSLQEQILHIWRETLNNPKIKSTDPFFEIGGNSVALIEIHTKIKQLIDIELPITDLFYYPTVEKLAEYLMNLLKNNEYNLSTTVIQNKDFDLEKTSNEAIAIIGVAANLPDAPTIEKFWQNLKERKEGIHFFSNEELQKEGVSETVLQAQNYVKAKGFLANGFDFDAYFFGVSPSEATIMDPQHRLLLECAWTALEDAGYVEETPEIKIGVFVTQSNIQNYLQTYLLNNHSITKLFNEYQLYINNSSDFLSTKISYKFNFTGPSFTIQSGCSSSLLAIAQACQNLRNKQCDIAVAGGVTLTMPLKSGYPHQEGMILSSDGHCRVFDNNANGTVPGNGVGVVVLKRLSEALADNDHIEAIIKGFSINNDGANKLSFTAPNQQGQIEVIKNALKNADCHPNDITYIEAHGTGTPLGDPIEIAALDFVFKDTTRSEPCLIGSVKSNIGHLDVAAGVAGLIKTIMCLKYSHLAPNLHFKTPNKNLDLDSTPFSVVTEFKPWTTKQLPRRAGVSAFAVGGTNVHMVLEEAPYQQSKTRNTCKNHLIVLSAKTCNALIMISKNVANFLTQNPNCCLENLSYTLQVGRKAFDHRLAFIGSDHQNISQMLNAINPDSNIIRYRESTQPIVFLFPGQGSSFLPLIKAFYSKYFLFTQLIDFCQDYLKKNHNIELFIFDETNNPSSISSSSIHHTLGLFITEYALAKQWVEWGVYPSALLGHSLGEYVAACLAGIWTLEDTLEILLTRSILVSTTADGAMLSISLNKEELIPYLNDEIVLAVENSLKRCVVSGPHKAINTLKQQLINKNIVCKLLDISHAYHSPQMDTITDLFFEKLQHYVFFTPQIPIVSNVTGTWLTEQEAKDPRYWVNHLCKTVQFSKGVDEVLNKYDLFLEIGLGATLSTLIKQHKKTIDCFNVQEKSDGNLDNNSLLEMIGKLWSEKVSINWHQFNLQKNNHRISLPTYPFEHKTYRPETIEKKNTIKDWLYIPMWNYTDLQDNKESKLSFILVFKDNFGLSDKVISLLQQKGHSIITVTISKIFHFDGNNYQFDPNSTQHYQELAKHLMNNNQLPNKIINFWPLLKIEKKPSINTATLDEPLIALIYLCRMLFSFRYNKKVDLLIITNCLWSIFPTDKIIPEQSLLLGPILTLPNENPNVRCRAIDIELPGGKKFTNLNAIAINISKEIAINENGENLIAYRNNRRLTKSYNQLSLQNKIEQFSSDGVYLITGGLGAIGLCFAKFIAQSCKATFILLQRTPFPSKQTWDILLSDEKTKQELKNQIKTLQEIDAQGNEIQIISADVSDFKQLNKIIYDIQNQFGRITGVIHAAGIAGGGLIQTISLEMIKKTLEPKIVGAINIYHALKTNPPNFTIFCSALSGVIGSLGQVAYNSANCFLDNFAVWLSMQHFPALSINWDTWQDIGMASKLANAKLAGNKVETGIKEKEAIALLPFLFKASIPQLIISTTTLENKSKWLNTIWHPSKLITEKAKNFDKNKFDTVNDAQLAQTWKECLGVSSIDANDNFFDLGGDSLLGIQFCTILQEQYGIELKLQDLIEAPTFEKLVARSKLNTPKHNTSNFPLLLLRKGTGDTNLFLIHPVGGTVFIYRSLAEKIDQKISVYGLQSRSLDNTTPPICQVEVIASDYIQCIQSIQLKGPYYLAGTSFGGTLAYEVAQQLIEKKHKVNFLGLFDTPGLGQMPNALPTEADILAYMLQTGAQQTINHKKFYKLNLDQQLEYFLNHAGGLKKTLPSFDIHHMKHYLAIYKANIEAMFSYHPKPYQGKNKIHYFKAIERDPINPHYPEQGWKELLHDQLAVHSTPGNHITLLFNPFVQELADILNNLLTLNEKERDTVVQ